MHGPWYAGTGRVVEDPAQIVRILDALGEAVQAIEKLAADEGLPPGVQMRFQGAAQAFQASLDNTLWLILAAVVTMCANPANAAACTGTLPKYSVGNLGGLINSYSNRGRTLLDGFDIDARARWSLGEYGKLGRRERPRRRQALRHEHQLILCARQKGT